MNCCHQRWVVKNCLAQHVPFSLCSLPLSVSISPHVGNKPRGPSKRTSLRPCSWPSASAFQIVPLLLRHIRRTMQPKTSTSSCLVESHPAILSSPFFYTGAASSLTVTSAPGSPSSIFLGHVQGLHMFAPAEELQSSPRISNQRWNLKVRMPVAGGKDGLGGVYVPLLVYVQCRLLPRKTKTVQDYMGCVVQVHHGYRQSSQYCKYQTN